MSDWDSIFGEAALGLDLAKVDPARAGSARRRPRPAQPPRQRFRKLVRPSLPGRP